MASRNKGARSVDYADVMDWLNHRKPSRFRVHINAATARGCYVKLWREYTSESVKSENFETFMAHIQLAGHYPRPMSCDRTNDKYSLYMPRYI